MDAQPPSTESEREFARRLLADHEQTQHINALNAAEIVALREILESDRRWKWVVSGLKTWAVWIAAIIGAGTLGLEALKSAVKALGR